MSNKEIDSIQIGGNHYKTEEFMQQHWNVMILCNASYLQGCITKYLDRFDKKNGLADLQKATHYAEKLRANRYGPQLTDDQVKSMMGKYLDKFNDDPTPLRRVGIKAVMQLDMDTAILMIKELIAERYPEEPNGRYTDQD